MPKPNNNNKNSKPNKGNWKDKKPRQGQSTFQKTGQMRDDRIDAAKEVAGSTSNKISLRSIHLDHTVRHAEPRAS
jgi:hypothetical protein